MVYEILEESARAGTEDVISWEADNASFHVHKPKVFNATILPKYSKKKTKFRSFQRQLNIYGFKMTRKSGVYRHQLFKRGHPSLMNQIRPRTAQMRKKLLQRSRAKRVPVSDDENSSTNNQIHTLEPLNVQSLEPLNIQTAPDLPISMDDEGVVTTPLLRSISFESKDLACKPTRRISFESSELAGKNQNTNDHSMRNEVFPVILKQDNVVEDDSLDFDLFDNIDISGMSFCKCLGSGRCFLKNKGDRDLVAVSR